MCARRGALAKAGGAQITLIDRTNHFVFQPLLYQVATGLLSGGQISPALRGIFRKFPQVRVLLGEVEGFDLERRVVAASTPSTCSSCEYDTLILAAGATHSYFGRDDWAVLAPGMKSVDDANRLRSMILGAFELAEAAETAQERLAWMTFAIVGAGPTGVEMAGQVAELAQRILHVRVPLRGHLAGADRAAGLQPARARRRSRRRCRRGRRAICACSGSTSGWACGRSASTPRAWTCWPPASRAGSRPRP